MEREWPPGYDRILLQVVHPFHPFLCACECGEFADNNFTDFLNGRRFIGMALGVCDCHVLIFTLLMFFMRIFRVSFNGYEGI